MLPSTEQYDEAGTIGAIQKILAQALNPSVAVTPAQLSDLMEMFITLLHLRKVTIDYWMEVSTLGMRGFILAQRIQAEANLSNLEGLTEAQKKVIAASIDLSIQEIKALRVKIVEKLDVLVQMAPAGAKIH